MLQAFAEIRHFRKCLDPKIAIRYTDWLFVAGPGARMDLSRIEPRTKVYLLMVKSA
jgi:hypothetical protein